LNKQKIQSALKEQESGMKDNFKKRHAEDILTDDILLDKIERNICSENAIMENEFALASDIHNQINKYKNTLDPKSKQLIGTKIVRSINSHKRRKLVFRISSAAVLLLIVGISVLFEIGGESEIRTFAKNNSLETTSNNTRLILSGEKEIEINTDASKIEYAGNGNTIRIDASEEVIQNVEANEMALNTVIVPYGKRTQITLSDNSTIWLNSGSKLIYPAKFAADKREVYLEGEAIFEISHNKQHPFHVITQNVEVKVLGTVFNLSAYKDDHTVNTVLESGSVELKYRSNSIFGQSKAAMVPGMLATYDPIKGNIEQTQVNTSHYTSWREGYFIFKREPLSNILKKVSRYYNVSIQLNNQEMANETFSGQLDLRNSAIQVLEVIAEIMSVEVESVGNQILITRI
jgi:ferric-dicitrate binding protein FerR (iron transport regulator)